MLKWVDPLLCHAKTCNRRIGCLGHAVLFMVTARGVQQADDNQRAEAEDCRGLICASVLCEVPLVTNEGDLRKDIVPLSRRAAGMLWSLGSKLPQP